jgi:hypothetical protein
MPAFKKLPKAKFRVLADIVERKAYEEDAAFDLEGAIIDGYGVFNPDTFAGLTEPQKDYIAAYEAQSAALSDGVADGLYFNSGPALVERARLFFLAHKAKKPAAFLAKTQALFPKGKPPPTVAKTRSLLFVGRNVEKPTKLHEALSALDDEFFDMDFKPWFVDLRLKHVFDHAEHFFDLGPAKKAGKKTGKKAAVKSEKKSPSTRRSSRRT